MKESQISRISEIVADRIGKICKKAGIKSAPRFEDTLRVLNEFSNKFDENNTALVDMDMAVLTKTILDSLSFVDIVDLLVGLRSDQLPRGEMTRYFAGKPFRGDTLETEADARSRDHQFEFEVAKLLHRGGYKITKFNDVTATKQGLKFNIQCKRIRKIDNLEANFSKAYNQLVTHRQMSSREYGLIFICLDLPTGLEWKNITDASMNQVQGEFAKIQDIINPRVELYQQKCLSLNFLGTISMSRFAMVNDLRMSAQTILLDHFNHSFSSRQSSAIFSKVISDISTSPRLDANSWIEEK